MSNALSVIGKRLPRPQGPAQTTGAAQFAADIKLPGMLIGKVLRSPYPHAKILKIDKSKAENLPGVEAVITAEDGPKIPYSICNLSGDMQNPELPSEHKDCYVFNDKARFVGDPVAAVAAINEYIAEEALELIDVEYEKLPAVFDPIEAMKPGAPKIHDYAEGNVAEHIPYAFLEGDVEKGLQEADFIFEGTFRTTKQKSAQIEPNATVANFDHNGRLTVWSSSQQPHPARRQLARIFNMPEGKVRLLSPFIGGAFGSRQSFITEPVCIALARKAGKPVKLEDTREEDLSTREGRQPQILTAKLGIKKDGTITALQFKTVADAGAYFSHSGAVTSLCMMDFLELYRCPNKNGEADIVYTNTSISGGIRGYGNPPAMFALEQLMDNAAKTLGIDPIELRLKNIKRAGERGYGMLPIENTALAECIKLGAEKIGWQEKKASKKEGVIKRGIGMACAMHCSGAYPDLVEQSNAFIKLNADGSADVTVSATDLGQGIVGALGQIAAEGLGLRAEDVNVTYGDTDVTPFDDGAHASGSCYTTGNAVLAAATNAKKQLLERAAKALGVSDEELDTREGRVYVKTDPEKGIAIAEVVRNTIYDFTGEGYNISATGTSGYRGSSPFQATFVEVEVDTETGQVKVLKIVLAEDIGRAINPMTVEGQLEGGIVQGLGYTLTEDFVVDMNTGCTVTDSFDVYKLPTTLDLPEIEVILVEQPVASGPFGAKGVGELGLIAMAAATANAVYDAVGIQVKELPITPEKILHALESNQ